MNIPLSLSEWIGSDPWQEKHGIDPLIKQGIIAVLNDINKERSEAARSANRRSQLTAQQPALNFPQQIRPATTRYK